MPVAGPANPISVPVVDDDLAWDQIADVVSDYFPIAREQRARRGGEVWTEGRIETVPQDGATWLEPHRKDSVGSFNRWESTFQSIRRRATVRVFPMRTATWWKSSSRKSWKIFPSPKRRRPARQRSRSDDYVAQQPPGRGEPHASFDRAGFRWAAIRRWSSGCWPRSMPG